MSCTPPEILRLAANATQHLLPKSKGEYVLRLNLPKYSPRDLHEATVERLFSKNSKVVNKFMKEAPVHIYLMTNIKIIFSLALQNVTFFW